MAKMRVLVQRRKAVRNIRKITRTMELIATARFKRALDRASQAEAYTRKLAELAADLSRNVSDVAHPLMQQRPVVRNTALLVITSNRGLCGGYNASILREAIHRGREIKAAGQDLRLELSGRRSIIFFRFQGIPAAKTYSHFEDKPKFEEVEVVAQSFIDDFVAGRLDRVDVAYMKFLNVARQQAVVETLLPLTTAVPETRKPVAAVTTAGTKADYEFLPDAEGILAEVLPAAVKNKLFKAFLDAAVSEQIARRIAMKAATDNAGDLIKELSREYNRARQALITKEIAEVIGGAAALE